MFPPAKGGMIEEGVLHAGPFVMMVSMFVMVIMDESSLLMECLQDRSRMDEVKDFFNKHSEQQRGLRASSPHQANLSLTSLKAILVFNVLLKFRHAQSVSSNMGKLAKWLHDIMPIDQEEIWSV